MHIAGQGRDDERPSQVKFAEPSCGVLWAFNSSLAGSEG
jgi:hypothetical protein